MRKFYLVGGAGYFVLSAWAFITGQPDKGQQVLQTALLMAILAEVTP